MIFYDGGPNARYFFGTIILGCVLLIIIHSFAKINCMEIIATLLIGAIAGWLGSQLFKGRGLGLLGNIVVGILGSFVGYWLLGKMGVSFGAGWIGAILTGALGAIIILAITSVLFKSSS